MGARSGAIVHAWTLRRLPAGRLERSLANALRKFARVAWLLLDSPFAATRLLKLCSREEIAALEEPAPADALLVLEVDALEAEPLEVEPLDTDALSCWAMLDSPPPPWWP